MPLNFVFRCLLVAGLLPLPALAAPASHVVKFGEQEGADLYAVVPGKPLGKRIVLLPVIMNYRMPESPVASVVVEYELDCRHKQVRVARAFRYATPMGMGQLLGPIPVETFGPNALIFQPIVDDNLKAIRKEACANAT